jgi:formyltetrahydrofolate hydrolase
MFCFVMSKKIFFVRTKVNFHESLLPGCTGANPGYSMVNVGLQAGVQADGRVDGRGKLSATSYHSL